MLRLSLLLLALSACVCNAGVALFYGPVWDNNEFGFSLFDGDGDAPEVTPLRGTGRLVNAPSFKGVLAGVRTSIVYGAFRWLGNEPAFGLAAVDMAKLTIAPIYPSVFGSSVRLAAWRNEDAGSFFVLGDFTGSQSDPYVKVKGIASCFVDSGCAALTTGFLSIPSDSHPASMVWSAKTQTLAVMYTSGDVSPTVMLCQWKPSAGWFFRDVTPQYHNAVNEAMVVLAQDWLWITTAGQYEFTDMQCGPGAPSSDEPPPFMFNAVVGIVNPCWTFSPPMVNYSWPFRGTRGTAAFRGGVVAVVQRLSPFETAILHFTMHAVVDITLNLDQFVPLKLYHLLLTFVSGGDTLVLAYTEFESAATRFLVFRPNVGWQDLLGPTNAVALGSAAAPFSLTSDGAKFMWIELDPTRPGAFQLRSVALATGALVDRVALDDFHEQAAVFTACASADRLVVVGDMQHWLADNGAKVEIPSCVAAWDPTTLLWEPLVLGSDFLAGSTRPVLGCSASADAVWLSWKTAVPNTTLALLRVEPGRAPIRYTPQPLDFGLVAMSISAPKRIGNQLFAAWRVFAAGGVPGHNNIAIATWDIPPLPDARGDGPLLGDDEWKLWAVADASLTLTSMTTNLNLRVFKGALWVVSNLFLADSYGSVACRFDLATRAASVIPFESVPEIRTVAVGNPSAVGESGDLLWVGGHIRQLSSLGRVLNVAAMNELGNFTASTAALHAPAGSNSRVTQIAFDPAGRTMYVISVELENDLAFFSSGLNVFFDDQVLPDPLVSPSYQGAVVVVPLTLRLTARRMDIVLTLLVTALIVAAACGTVTWLWRYNRGRAFSQIEIPNFRSHSLQSNMGAILRDDSLKKLEVDQTELLDIIGQGGQATVRRARYKGQLVAAKSVLAGVSPDAFADFAKEIKLTSAVAHPNIVAFVGVLVKDEQLWLVTELMDSDLLSVMDQLDAPSKLRVTADVAKAMAYLHSFVPPVLHRDLKPGNVLIARDGRVKLADFGVSRLMPTQTAQAQMTKDAGTILYMPPEMWDQSGAYGTPADVYSYGLLLIELWTGQNPFAPFEFSWILEFIDRIRRGEVVPGVANMPPSCPAAVRELAAQCVVLNPVLRPSFRDIVRRLREVRFRHHDGSEPATRQPSMLLFSDDDDGYGVSESRSGSGGSMYTGVQ